MSRRRRQERFRKNQADWEKYGPAILDLMDRIEQLERKTNG